MTVEPRPSDDNQATAQTIARMRQYVREDSQAPSVQRAAHQAAAGAPSERRRAEAVWRWVRSHIRFVEDAELVRGISPTATEDEVLVRPVDLLAMAEPQGDCDDFAMLTAAMLRALGIRAAFRTIAADPAAPNSYSHVYAVAQLEDGPLALDSSHGPRPGWEATAAGKERTWPIDCGRRDRLRDSSGARDGDLRVLRAGSAKRDANSTGHDDANSTRHDDANSTRHDDANSTGHDDAEHGCTGRYRRLVAARPCGERGRASKTAGAANHRQIQGCALVRVGNRRTYYLHRSIPEE